MHTFPIPPVIKRFAKQFKASGFSLYIVGGAVRDHLLGLENEDYDFTTDALPEQVIGLFHHVIPTGIEHGTVTVHFEHQSFEVTTFRSEGDYRDGRHPDSVTFIRSLEEDLKRRDFTINAFAADCESGIIIDQHEGLQDLKHRVIRAIGDASQRFSEDGLRILRACRIAGKLDFSIEANTLDAMQAKREGLRMVSSERIRDELFKLVLSDHPSKGLYYLKTCRLLPIVLPELAAGEGIEQKGMHHQDVLDHGIAVCQASVALTGRLEVRLAALLHDIGKSEVVSYHAQRNTFYQHDVVGENLTKTVLKRLKASNEQIQQVSHLVRHHMFAYQSNWTDSAVRRFITTVGKDEIGALFVLRMADQIAIHGKADIRLLEELEGRIRTIIEQQDALSIKDLAINGNDLIGLGIPKGTRIGATLSYLLETVLDDPRQNERQQLLQLAKAYQSFLDSARQS
ncbi:MAG: CCA tRNA nucleotidyltransferase [Sphaerochaeta sp.]|uniref:CCA tRNA nucleotidyltransferase n=1 Tax=Sphaerochaeta sp. TaxID=1972642 RepID=UPI002FCC41D7